ncbi:MAG TPA: hypothetical protein DCS63_02030 [Elusimicrobia bacterium]|nr:hypothetical protein [Elusimicrobiota bacterium]
MAKKRRQPGRENVQKGSPESRGAGVPSVNARLTAAPDNEKKGGGALKGRVLWLSSLVLIVSGYFLLRWVDPGGQNAWAVASPALLLAGYLLIFPAIIRTYR